MRLALLQSAPPDAPEGLAGVVRWAQDEVIMGWWIDEGIVSQRGLEAVERLLRDPRAPGTLLAWSGGMGESPHERDPRTWMAPGREALAEACERLAPALEASGKTLLLRAHCRHVLSDAPACAHFVGIRPSARLGVALDPASMLERSMLARAGEHLERIISIAGAAAEMLVLGNVREPSSPEEDAPPLAAGPGEGAIDEETMVRLAREAMDDGAALLVVGPEAERRVEAVSRTHADA